MEEEYVGVEEYLINFYKEEFEKASWTKGKELTVKNIFKHLDLWDEIIDTFDQDHHRHWTNETAVIQVGDKYIAFETAFTTGDMSAEEKGWEWDGEIWFVEPEEEVVRTWV